MFESCIVSPLTESFSARLAGRRAVARRQQPGPRRAARRPPLLREPVEGEMRVGALAHEAVARRDVVDDRVGGDVLERVARRDAVRATADHRRELDLPVELRHALADLHDRPVADQRRRRLEEEERPAGGRRDRVLRTQPAHLAQVVGVVRSHHVEVRRVGHRRQQRHLGQRDPLADRAGVDAIEPRLEALLEHRANAPGAGDAVHHAVAYDGGRGPAGGRDRRDVALRHRGA